ncbi:MAG: pyridoxal-phosphate-dependent aminotransferase family protein [Candidatus Kariarchaeaceae archaeon]|jgi:aspartate aminotransferase-like enzyme
MVLGFLIAMYDRDRVFLAIPGPVEIHPKVYAAMNQHVYGHRTQHFRELYQDCVSKFQETINTNRTVQIHAGSGTLGLHAAITNLTSRKDKVLNLVNGKFGERVEQICERFCDDTHTIKVPYGDGINPETVQDALKRHPDTTLVTITHNETSTGVLNPLPEISKIVHEHDALLMADCITSAGGDLVKMDEWDIDLFVSGSQKCYGLPPGLGFVAFSQAAEDKMREISRNQDYYSDLLMFDEKEIGVTPFTPAVGLIYGLNASLDLILEEGMEKRIHRHRKMGALYREAMEGLGLDLFAQEGFRSNTVTTVKVPNDTDANHLAKSALDMGIMIAGGQGSMKGKIFRVGHMNLVGPRELLMIVAVLELSLKKAGATIPISDGIRIIQEGLLK